MADLCSLSALLFWTGIFVLASSSTAAPAPPQCSYTVTYNRSVLKIEVKPPGDYNITVFEDQPGTKEKIQVQNSSVWQSDPLKPCTEYSHRVSFNDGGKEIFCNTQENKTRTDPMSEDDIKENYCIPEHVCYESEWDLSSSIQTPDNLPVIRCRNDKKTFCVRPANKHICSDLTITFTSGACGNASFIDTKSISVDFLNSSEIYQIKSTGLPAKIEATLPELPKCGNLSVSYTCSENTKPDVEKNLSELEPFTDYSCTGLILKNNIPTNKTTPAIQFIVNCDLTITYTKKNPFDTSIELSWKTTSEKCKDVLQNFSYDCSCQRKDQKNGPKQGRTHEVTETKLPPDEGTCRITGLDPYTNYTCQVKPKYNNECRDATGTEVKLQTTIGRPEAVSNLKLFVQEHNTIIATWHKTSAFNGPDGKYIVRLSKAGDKLQEKTLNSSCTKCDSIFEYLSYSTTYKVEVVASNKERESLPQTKEIDTLYNDKAVIGFLVFLIIVTGLALIFVVYKIYIKKFRKARNDVNEAMALEARITYVMLQQKLLSAAPLPQGVTTAVYVNT